MHAASLPACAIAILVLTLPLTGNAAAEERASVSFRNDVMALLSKHGCNQGACHGNQNGKNGFKLSLRGQDPEFDLDVLSRGMLARRADPFAPERSLLLVKATAEMPHEGGRRFEVGSKSYDVLYRWIAAGCAADPAETPKLEALTVTPAEQVLIEPADRMKIGVQARFSDGSVRDVTSLAVYEPSNLLVSITPEGEVGRLGMGETAINVRYLHRQATVRVAFVPARPEFVWSESPPANFIDEHVFTKLRALRINPSELCSDSAFARRAYLDAIGLLPTADEARSFLSDSARDKRGRLIDQLLNRPEFADFWAQKWADVLRNEEKVIDRKGVQVFHRWLRQSIAQDKPLNDLARELIAAQGSTYTNPPANFYRAHRDPQVRAETAAQVFLGIRLQCARCHNHPFDRWTQDDYYSLSAFFARVDYKILENNRRDRNDLHEFDGEQVVWLSSQGEVKHPRTGEAVAPRSLDKSVPLGAVDEDPLSALADWIAHPQNELFSRTQINRVWYHLLGRGIVDPLDDFRASNPPVNEPLLAAVCRDFVAHGFSLRHAVRTIMSSRTYQLSAAPNETNRDDEINFSRAVVRPLQAEQLLDALAQVTGHSVKFNGYPLGLRAGELSGVRAVRDRESPPTMGERFLTDFGKPERLLSCECERTEDTTVRQSLQLITGELINELLTSDDNRVGRLLTADRSNDEIVAELYLASLSRMPSDDELRAAERYIANASNRRTAVEDMVWGLVNVKEFLLRQ